MNNNNDVTNMDLDLNQDPVQQSSNTEGLGTLLDELETAHDQIEERIRRLEAVTDRARLRQLWRLRHHHRLSTEPINPTVTNNESKSLKRDNSHLVSDESSGFFDCNICLDTAREPILTCCGHLFCWACFFRVKCLENGTKECPVCKGEVNDTGVTPIYGNGKSADMEERETVVPPRPKARRVESVRQRRVARSATHVPVAEALRRIRRDVGNELGGRWRIRTHQFLSVLPEGASSLYSISSALDNAERLVGDLEGLLNEGVDGNSRGVDSSASSSQPDNSVSRVVRIRRIG